MAFDAFLKLDGITGESTASGHEGWIEILSFSWGASNTESEGAAVARAGKVKFQEFHVTKHLDSSSPKLFLASVTGENIQTAQIDLVRASQGAPEVFFTYKLSDVLISSVSNDGTSGGQDVPQEAIALNFTKIEVSYAAATTESGVPTTSVPVSYDLKANKGA